MKKIFSLLLFCFLTLTAWAEGKNLVITFDNGSTQAFLLSEKPEVNFGNDKLIVTAGTTTAEYALNEVMTFTFAETSDIKQIVGTPEFSWQNAAIVFSAPIDVEAYSADGVRLDISYTKTSQSTIVVLSSLPKGITILRAANKTIKICK